VTREELKALAKRVMALTGPDREVDAALYLALNPHMLPIPGADTKRFYDPAKTNALTASKFFLGGGATGVALRFTADLNAAMSLVPVGWHTFLASQDRHSLRWEWCLRGGFGVNCKAFAATPALALTAAALLARAEQMGEGEG
jgi:hypothetical protein